MANIPLTYVPIVSSGGKRVSYILPSGGVKFSEDGGIVAAGKCRKMNNFDLFEGKIKSRKAFYPRFDSFVAEGEFHGMHENPFYDKIIFHAGTCLYSYDGGENPPELISDILPDKKSIFCEFLSKLFIYCGTHVYSIDNGFKFTEEMPDAPLIYKNVVPGIRTSGVRTENNFNMLSPVMKVDYVETDSYVYHFPIAPDLSRPLRIYEGDVLIETGYEVSQDNVQLVEYDLKTRKKTLSFVYYPLDPKAAGFENIIEDCCIMTAFGGNAAGGTRLFLSGNENKKGYYYKSPLLNPLYIGYDEFEIIGDGCENVTCMKKMYGDLMIFTENSIYRMKYSFNEEGTYFTVKEISSEAGCDCPGSVQLIDNRLVFANSKRGIFILDSAEESGEQNIKPISGNILSGSEGLSKLGADNLKKSKSLDFDRKYMLFADGVVYIWDYDTTAFHDSGNYGKAQERLCWYTYDGINGDGFIGLGGYLFALSENDGVKLYCLGNGENDDAAHVFESGISECFLPETRKHITEMDIRLCRYDDRDIVLSLYSDTEKYFEMILPKRKKEREKIRIKLPRKAVYGFGFSLMSQGKFEISSVSATYFEING